MDKIVKTSNGFQCRLRSTLENQKADPNRFSCGDTCFCDQDWSIWKVTLDYTWKEMT